MAREAASLAKRLSYLSEVVLECEMSLSAADKALNARIVKTMERDLALGPELPNGEGIAGELSADIREPDVLTAEVPHG
jgi:hypothetical protein